MQVPLEAEKIFSIAGIGVTNAVFTGVVVTVIITLFCIYLRAKLNYSEPGKLQVMVEMIVEYLFGLVDGVMHDKAKALFGFMMTFFTFILVANLFALLPFVPATVVEHEVHAEEETHDEYEGENTIITDRNDEELYEVEGGIHEADEIEEKEQHHEVSLATCWETRECVLTTEGVKIFPAEAHIFRAPASDINMPFAFAIISVIVTNVLGFYYLKLDYLKKFINFSNPINFIVGILEVISELGKVISFTFRLFGNVFAGEVLLAIITGITLGAATLPFLMFELFVALIQAFVFFMLTTMFISVASTSHGH